MLLRYLAARLRHWDPAVVGYLKMGLGIEHRARRLAPFWAEHLQRSRSAQARWAQHFHGEWLTVLGAGRLLDFNRTVLLPRFKKLRLVDADPLCRHIWKQLPKPVEPVCADMSGCLLHWMRALGREPRRPWAETLDWIAAQQAPANSAFCAEGDALLSLNTLSQLQIVWQDQIEAFLQRRFGRAFVKRHDPEWLNALRPGGQSLVEQHLESIERSGPKFALLISDEEYLEYKGARFDRDHWAPPPVEWSPETGWSTCMEGLSCEVTPALEGVHLSESTFAAKLPSYRLAWQERWLWHIEPLGADAVGHGKVHRVGAFALERLPIQ